VNRKLTLALFVLLFLFFSATKISIAGCSGSGTFCDLIFEEFVCSITGGYCSSNDDCYNGDDDNPCVSNGWKCNGKAVCDCVIIAGRCVPVPCNPGQLYFSDTCNYSCDSDCSCKSNTCVGETCSDGCGGNCDGTKANDCSCAANTCIGQTCDGTCGKCDGTKVDESLTSCSGTQVQYTETPQTTGTI
jgi:hypothetical protein